MTNNTNHNWGERLLEALPYSIYVINRKMEVVYYNQRFATTFKPEVHSIKPYFGLLVKCGYCTPGGADMSQPSCSNCLITRQHLQCWESKRNSDVQEVVQEFAQGDDKGLKFLKIQSIFLDEEHLMGIVQDYTEEAKKLAQMKY